MDEPLERLLRLVEEIRDLLNHERRAAVRRAMHTAWIARQTEIGLERPGDCMMILSAAPLTDKDDALLDLRDKSLRNLMQSPPVPSGFFNSVGCGQAYPVLAGLRSGEVAGRKYLQVSATGSAEFVKVMRGQGQADSEAYFSARADSQYLVSFAHFAMQLYARYLQTNGVVFRAVFINAQGLRLAIDRNTALDPKWPRQVLNLGEIEVRDIVADGRQVAQRFADQLWNAFHQERADNFDESGNLTLR
jgi:hypothetical protein